MTKYHRYFQPLILTLALIFGILTPSCTSKTGVQNSMTTAGIQSSVGKSGSQTAVQSYMKEKTVDHPIYLGFLLIDEPTIETMVDLCEYYDLTPEETTDGYTAYRATDGTLLRFKQSDDPTAGVNGNLIEIQTRASQKTLSKILNNLKYTKVDKATTQRGATVYDHGSNLARNHIRCFITPSSPRTLTFRSISNNTY